MSLFRKTPKEEHTCTMSRCCVEYEPKEMIYTVTLQCKFCGRMDSFKANSDCIHDLLKAVTMGY